MRLTGAVGHKHCSLPAFPALQEGCRTPCPGFFYFCLSRNAVTLLKDPVHLIWELNTCMLCRYLMKESSLNKLCSLAACIVHSERCVPLKASRGESVYLNLGA